MDFIKGGVVMGMVTQLFAAIPWTALLLFAPLLGFSYVTVDCSEKCLLIQKRMRNSSEVTAEGTRLGFSVGCWFVLQMKEDRMDTHPSYSCWIFGWAPSVQELITLDITSGGGRSKPSKSTSEAAGSGSTACTAAPPVSLTIFQSYGSYFFKRSISCKRFLPRPEQSPILSAVLAHYENSDSTVAFVHGRPGTGKSMLGLVLAQQLQTSYCNSFCPWEKSSGILAELYVRASPTKEKPLILGMDEIDIVLSRVHAGVAATLSGELPVVHDKASWNRWFDDLNRGMYPHVIVLMTSNRTPADIHALDPCYIRPGRVDLISSTEPTT